MKKLTKEQVLGMSKDQLLADDFRSVMEVYLEDYGTETPVRDHVNSYFGKTIDEWEQRVRHAFKAGYDNMDADVAALAKEPGLVQVLIWSRLTNRGIDELDFIKYVHMHFAKTILEQFGMVNPGPIGVVPNVPGLFRGTRGR